MKKAIVLALVVMLTLSLAMPAAAVISPVGSKTSQTDGNLKWPISMLAICLKELRMSISINSCKNLCP